MTYWLSSRKMTIAVRVEVVIVEAPPIARKFIGQPLENLVGWMTRQGGFRMERLDGDTMSLR